MVEITEKPSEASCSEKTSLDPLQAANENLQKNFRERLAQGIIDINQVIISAIRLDKLALLKIFTKYEGADVNSKPLPSKKTALHLASEKGDIPFIEFLLDNGADVNARDKYGDTPLSYRFRNEEKTHLKEVAEVLLSRGADPNAENKRSETPFFMAVAHGDIELVKLFLSYGSEVNLINYTNKTALESVIKDTKSTNLEALEFILKYGADVNVFGPYDYKNVLTYSLKNCENNPWRTILKHVAIIQTVGSQSISHSLNDTILNTGELESYFEKCQSELKRAKSTKLRNSWVSFYHLLMHNEGKMCKYAGNENIIKDFEETNLKDAFPIYGDSMKINVSKGIKVRKFWDTAAWNLSNKWPIFDFTHLVIKDTIDCLDLKDLPTTCQ